MLVVATAFCQSYYEASGQTEVFTLTAGTKAGWNPAIAVEEAKADKSMACRMEIYPNPTNTGITIKVQGSKGQTKVKIFDVSGKMVQVLDLMNKTTCKVASGLTNGIYFARVIENGNTMKTSRFLVVR